MSVLLAKRALPRSLGDTPPPEVAAALAQLPHAFGQLALASGETHLNIKALKGQPGLYRLRVGDWRAIFFRTGDDFLVAAIGLRKDIYERVDRMRLARKGEGVRIIELPQPQEARRRRASVPSGSARAGARGRVAEPASAFSDASCCGSRALTLDWLRCCARCRRPSTSDAAFARRLDDPDLALLLADLWERPDHHLASFADGGAPRADDLVLEVEELAARLVAPDSETELVATETEGQIRKLLDRSIEEWMVYLHPSQRAIANANFNGPARVRGGPGTGKTVVALHRARVLARKRVEAPDKVLLTTFLSTLPKVWTSLMGLLDPAGARAARHPQHRPARPRARRCRRTAAGSPFSTRPPGRKNCRAPAQAPRPRQGAWPATRSSCSTSSMRSSPVAGSTTLEDYLALRRRGGGSGLGRGDRERVFAAFTEYRAGLSKRGLYDWPHIRLEALDSPRAAPVRATTG